MNFTTSRRHLSTHVPVSFQMPGLPGIHHVGVELRFDRGRYTEEQASFITALSSGLPVHAPTVTTRSDVLGPTPEQLERINEDALVTLGSDDVLVYNRYVVNDQISRTIGLRISKGGLERLAEDYREGRSRALLDHLPIFGGHSGAVLVGRTIDATVVEETVRGVSGHWIKTTEYIPKAGIDPRHLALITSGVLTFDSIGFVGGGLEIIQESATGSGPGRDIIQIYDDVNAAVRLQAKEITFVYLGEMRGAGSDRGVDAPQPKPKKTSWVISI